MATIGSFTKTDNGYTGTLTTLTLKATLTLEPLTTKRGEKSPDYRVLAGDSDIGAAWQRTSREGAAYLSVLLDDPSFPAAIFCSLIKTGVEKGYSLVWERPKARD